MKTSFENKVVLVTGGTSGIGRVTALAFAAAGAAVVVSGRREPEGLAVVAEIKAMGGKATFVRADVARESEVKALIDAVVAAHGRLDVAFNNAGVESTGPVTELTEAEYRRVFDINVWGVLASMKHEIPVMLKNGGGAIINTSSIAGQVGMAGASLYVAAKHAVEGITKAAAIEYAKLGIRVNAVAPAAIETDMLNRFTGGTDEAMAYMRGLHPVGRVGSPAEIANPVLFLASDAASFVTGVSLPVDGGFLAQ
jgi:NAD(P)-dependent dehydrogenase (short-subunit alcohol dehydrogenase family)